MKKFLFILLTLFQLASSLSVAYAQKSPDLTVTPAVIDEKGKPRDILKESITVTNNTTHVLELYPSVNDINTQIGEQGFQRANDSTALENSLANWIEITRGMIELKPGEQKQIPFIVRINLNAIPSSYHAQISLTEGGTRAEADSKPALGVVMVNLEVQADIKEMLQLTKFSTGNFFLSGDDVLFNYQLQNIGNQELAPKGEVHIYNRNGSEVATIDVNKAGKLVSPDQVSELASVWTAAQGFGRYKALLTVNYGATQTASVQDTVFFWVVPWKQLLILFSVSLIIVVFLAIQFHNWFEQRHFHKLAHAGLLSEEVLKEMQLPIRTEPVQSTSLTQKAAVETSIEKKSRFFRKKHKDAVSAEEPKKFEEKEQSKSLKEVLQKSSAPQSQGGAINLKGLSSKVKNESYAPPQSASSQARIEGNVISLKKKI